MFCRKMRARARVRVRAERERKPRAAVGLWLERGCQSQVEAAKRPGLGELFHLGFHV